MPIVFAPMLRAYSTALSAYGVRPLAEMATRVSEDLNFRALRVAAAALRSSSAPSTARVRAGPPPAMIPWDGVARHAKSGRDLGGVEQAEPPARSRADIEPAPTPLERLVEDIARRDQRVEGVQDDTGDLGVLADDPGQNVARLELVEVARARIAAFGDAGWVVGHLEYRGMGFRCDAATLERLEWNRLLLCLGRCASTERGAHACLELGFEATRAGVLERLAETSEIRRLLDADERLPFGGVSDLRPLLEVLEKGQVASAASLADVRASIDAGLRLKRFLEDRSERAPVLADLAGTLPDLAALSRAIDAVVSPEGRIRDDASPTLRSLRRQVRDLEAEIDKRMRTLLRDSKLREHLQDQFATQREGRAVIPVKADSKGAVRGIVHDISSSGTTVFIEPEGVIEHGNRLRLARREIEREEERLLRELSRDVAAESASLAAAGNTLERIDVASARGRISQQLDAREPELADDAPLSIRELSHPLLRLEAGLEPEQIVANDIGLGEGEQALIISGPNAGGKTVAAKAVGLAALALRAGMHLPCGEESRLPVFDAVSADIGDEQDLRSGLSTFSARMSNLARIAAEADGKTLVIVDEIGEGTEPAEGAALAQALLEAFVDRGADCHCHHPLQPFERARGK